MNPKQHFLNTEKINAATSPVKTWCIHMVIALGLSSAMFSTFAKPQPEELFSMGNPASANCAANHDGSLFLATDSKTGGQYGICQLSEHLAVEEWCLYRKDQNIDKKDCPNLIILLQDGNK